MKYIFLHIVSALISNVGALSDVQEERSQFRALRSHPARTGGLFHSSGSGQITTEARGLPPESKIGHDKAVHAHNANEDESNYGYGSYKLQPEKRQETPEAAALHDVEEAEHHVEEDVEEAEHGVEGHGAHGAKHRHEAEAEHWRGTAEAGTAAAREGDVDAMKNAAAGAIAQRDHGEHGHGHDKGHFAFPGAHHEEFSLGMYLLGSVGALMSVFYLVNAKNAGVKQTAWRVLNMTTSIFVAVLFYGTIRMAIFKLANPGVAGRITITLCMFVLFFFLAHFILFKLRNVNEKSQLVAFATVMGHVCGFAAMYGFADSYQVSTFENMGVWGYVVLIIMCTFIVGGMIYVADKLMFGMALADGSMDENEERWMEVCDETDDDIFALAISFLMAQMCRGWVREKNMSYMPGKVGNVTQTDANWLFSLFVVFCVLTGGGAAFTLKHLKKRSQAYIRVMTLINHVMSMTTAWLLLFWAEWQLYVWGWDFTVIGGCLLNAIALTMFSFAMCFVLNAIEDSMKSKASKRAVDSVELALGILVGFSWERAFDVAFEAVEHTVEYDPNYYWIDGLLAVTILSGILLAIVAPAWRFYILPKAEEFDENDNQSLSTAKS